jgi:hypothetical protein
VVLRIDRTQPGLPMKPGRLGTTLFPALNVLDAKVIGCYDAMMPLAIWAFVRAVAVDLSVLANAEFACSKAPSP